MPAPDSILQLVEHFETHRLAYLSPDYNETQVRRKLTSRLSETMSNPILDEWDEPLWESAQMENLIVLWFTRLAQIWDFSNRIHRSRDHFLETIRRL